MTEQALTDLLFTHYGLKDVTLQFLRKGGSCTYLVKGKSNYLLKVIGTAFAHTSFQSISIMQYLKAHGFPVPGIIPSQSGEAFLIASIDGEDQLILLQEFIHGQEPDLTARAADVGALIGRLHNLLDLYPEKLVARNKQFFIGRYLDFLRQKNYPQLPAYEELGDMLWQQVEDQPMCNCHGDLHRGNLLETPDGQLYLLDFDTICHAPAMFDVMVMCDMTDYFHLKQSDIAITNTVYDQFLSAYLPYRVLTQTEQQSFANWVAIRHFQLQATILEIYGIDCINEKFIDAQLDWLKQWTNAANSHPAP